MTLEGKKEIPAKIYNPLPGKDRITFKLEASGDIRAWYVDHPMQEEFSQTVGGRQNISKYITVMPTSCWSSDCQGNLKATVISQETGLNSSKDIDVKIKREGKGLIGAAPGLSIVELAGVSIIGSLISLLISQRQ